MTAGLGRGIALAALGVAVGLAIVAALFGSGDLSKRVRGVVTTAQEPRPDKPSPSSRDQAAIDPGSNPLAALDRSPQAEKRPGDETTPSLDILRVEPTGDTVLAGRGAPNAAIEILRDNQTVARTTADESGQFAIDSLALPPGNSELTLRSTAPGGETAQGKASAVVVVDRDKKAQPLVAVSEPDKPTRVLSMPGPTADAGKPAGAGDKPATGTPPHREAALPGTESKPGGPPAESTPVKIVSVDAQEGGRLFVSGQGAAWTSLRLYLNETLVASGRAGADGRIAFTIGRGVRPGSYQIRIDQVEAESGKVGGRAQVGFTVPAQLAAKEAAREPVKTASKDMPAASTKPETQAADRPEMPPSTPSGAMKPSPSGSTSTAAGESRPAAGTRSPDSDKRTAEALSPKFADAGKPPGTAATAATSPSGAALQSLPTKPPGDQAATVFVPEIDTAKIIRGDSLWQISRRSYGDGKRYTVIYDANREQIRDPNLIYPGQIFVMPKDTPAASGQPAKRG